MRFKNFSVIVSFAIVVAFLFSLTVPTAYASFSPTSIVSDVGFFDWLVGKAVEGYSWVKAIFDEDVCPSAPSPGFRHEFETKNTMVGGKVGTFSICKYCGKSAGEVLPDAYDTYVTDTVQPELGTTQVGPSGLIIPIEVTSCVAVPTGDLFTGAFVAGTKFSLIGTELSAYRLCFSLTPPVTGLYTFNGNINYSLPFNMYTFNKMWSVTTPEDAAQKIEEQRRAAGITEPRNLEEQAISLVGTDIYERLVKGYTEKQWGRDCKDLPSFIIKRLPVRFTYDNNYFNALYQGIPVGGYTRMVESMLEGIEVRLGVDYLEHKSELDALAEKVVYTGPIDAYFGYRLGTLEYRSVRFETEMLDKPSFQGNAVVNYTDRETPYTRIIEHKWFEFGKDADGNELPKTVISREYSAEWKPGDEPYYPVNDEKNSVLYAKYKELADKEPNVIFGGRLGEYKYYDMDQVVKAALTAAQPAIGA